jgi:putative DNA primase/helicase
MNLAAVPSELKRIPQWVGWKYEMVKGKRTKVPKNPQNGHNAASDNPKTWSNLEIALSAKVRYRLDGIGFVFSRNDPYCGIDLDDCRNPETGQIEAWALDVVRSMNSYTEVSVSGTGLHIIVKGKLPPTCRKKGRVEMYDERHYFAITGQRIQ